MAALVRCGRMRWPMRPVFARDMPSSSVLTWERFGWEPTHPSLIADLAADDYPALS